MVGVVVNSNVSGIMLVTCYPNNTSTIQGTNNASWGIGDGTTSSARTLTFKNSSTGTLSWTPTGTRTLTLPDTTGTLAATDANNNLTADAFIPGATSTPTAGGTTTLTADSKEVQIFTGSSNQTVVLPTTGVTAGQRYTMINLSSGSLTVNASGGGLAVFIQGGQKVTNTLVAAISTPTAGADWVPAPSLPNGITASMSATTFSLGYRDGNANLIADAFVPGLTSTATAAGTTALTVDAKQVQVFTGSTTQTVTLPTTSITAGHPVTLINNSTGDVTVNASGGALVATLLGGQTCVLTANTATPTLPAHWTIVGGTVLINPTITNYTESVVAIGNTSTAKTLDLTSGTVQTATLTGNCTFTMPTNVAGKSFVLYLKTGAGSFTATFTSVKWPTAGAPTITATAGKMDILTFVADGASWYGSYTQGYTP
jgi:hypothetical protein